MCSNVETDHISLNADSVHRQKPFEPIKRHHAKVNLVQGELSYNFENYKNILIMAGSYGLILSQIEKARLTKYVQSFEFRSHYYGIETRPSQYVFEDHCVVPKRWKGKKGNRTNFVIAGIQISRPYQANFVLNNQEYLLPGFSISHICGKTGCLQPSHMQIESDEDNAEREECHAIIDDWVDDRESDGTPREDRIGTIFCHEDDCPHNPTCFKNIGWFTVI